MARRRAEPRVIATRGELVVETDPARPSGRLLRDSQMESSYVDLADATHLEFDYMRWLRLILRAARARRVLHLGGGACALARALAAEDPGGRHEVCEIDSDVLELAREHLGLRRMPGLRVRHAEGRAFAAAAPDGCYDAVVVDAFVGARVPASLIEACAARDYARIAPLGLVNVVDGRVGRVVGAIAAGLAQAYPRTWAVGGRTGNTIVVGERGAHRVDLDRLAATIAADPSPARLTRPDALAAVIAGAPPVRDPR